MSGQAVSGRTVSVPGPRGREVHVEALPALEWSLAIEQVSTEARRTWIHRAPMDSVLALYQRARAEAGEVPAPWWLRAVYRGVLPSREAGFRVEDTLATILTSRTGWAYMPWAGDGEDGYWEFVPSEIRHTGEVVMPTAIVLTDRHPGWLDVVPAHTNRPPEPLAIAAMAELRERLDDIETW